MKRPIMYQDLYFLPKREILNEVKELSSVVSEKRFNEISDRIFSSYFHYSHESTIESLTINGMSKIFFEIIHFCFEKESYTTKKIRPPSNLTFSDNFFRNSRAIHMHGLKKKLFHVLRWIYRNRTLICSPQNWFKRKIFCAEYPYSFADDFVLEKNLSIIYLEKELMYRKPSHSKPSDHCKQVFSAIVTQVNNLRIELSTEEVQQMESLWNEFYNYVFNYILRSHQICRLLGAKNFVGQSVGNIEARAIGLSMRLINNGKFYGFGHAHDIGIGITIADNVTAQILNPITEFLTPSHFMKKLVINLSKTTPNLNERLKISTYKQSKLSFKQLEFKDKSVKKVFIYEHGLIERRFKGDCLHWPYQINLIQQLSDTFLKNKKQRQYSVALKGNPSHLELTHRFYEGFFDEIVETKFEDVVEEADLLIFPHIISTSSLIPALASSCYIIIFEEVLTHCWQSVAPLLRERCMILTSSRNQDDSIRYDEEELLSLIDSPKPFTTWSHF